MLSNLALLRPGELSLEVLNPQKYTQLCSHSTSSKMDNRSEHHPQLKCEAEQAAEGDYGTTGCGCTLPGTKIDAIFLCLYSLIRDSMPSQQ